MRQADLGVSSLPLLSFRRPASQPEDLGVTEEEANELQLVSQLKPRGKQRQIAPAGVLAILKQHKLFREPQSIHARLPEITEYTSLRQGAVLFRQGDPPGNCYIILSGEVGVYRLPEDGSPHGSPRHDPCPPTSFFLTRRRSCSVPVEHQPALQKTVEGYSTYHEKFTDFGHKLGVRGAGMIVGELALLNDAKRSATVRCLADCEFLVISRFDFDRLLKEDMQRSLQERVKFIIRHVPGMKDLPPPSAGLHAHAAYIFKSSSVHLGHVFFKQGHQADDALYVIASGTVDVHHADAGLTRHVGTLTAGSIFGSSPTLGEEPFTLTAASAPCEVFYVAGSTFNKLPKALHEVVQEYLAEMTTRNLERLKKNRSQADELSIKPVPSVWRSKRRIMSSPSLAERWAKRIDESELTRREDTVKKLDSHLRLQDESWHREKDLERQVAVLTEKRQERERLEVLAHVKKKEPRREVNYKEREAALAAVQNTLAHSCHGHLDIRDFRWGLSSLPEHLWSDRYFIFQLLRVDAGFLKYAAKHLRSDKELLLAAAKQAGTSRKVSTSPPSPSHAPDAIRVSPLGDFDTSENDTTPQLLLVSVRPPPLDDRSGISTEIVCELALNEFMGQFRICGSAISSKVACNNSSCRGTAESCHWPPPTDCGDQPGMQQGVVCWRSTRRCLLETCKLHRGFVVQIVERGRLATHQTFDSDMALLLGLKMFRIHEAKRTWAGPTAFFTVRNWAQTLVTRLEEAVKEWHALGGADSSSVDVRYHAPWQPPAAHAPRALERRVVQPPVSPEGSSPSSRRWRSQSEPELAQKS